MISHPSRCAGIETSLTEVNPQDSESYPVSSSTKPSPYGTEGNVVISRYVTSSMRKRERKSSGCESVQRSGLSGSKSPGSPERWRAISSQNESPVFACQDRRPSGVENWMGAQSSSRLSRPPSSWMRDQVAWSVSLRDMSFLSWPKKAGRPAGRPAVTRETTRLKKAGQASMHVSLMYYAPA